MRNEAKQSEKDACRVSLFRFKLKDAKRSETKQNEVKRSETKRNEAKPSKTKQNKAKKMRKQTLSRPEEAKLSKTKCDCFSFAYMNHIKQF
jgi:hypothetical protein